MSVRQQTLTDYIDHLCLQAFTGTLVIHFDQGYPAKVKQETMYKPEDLRQAMRRPVFVVRKKPEAPGAPETVSAPPEEGRKERQSDDSDGT